MPGPPRPAVSICVPSYDNAEHIGRALESALAQTFEDFELLVIDDASTDGTVDVVRGIDDPRLRLLVNERNAGLVANHNRCLVEARGTYVKFLHGDDLLEPQCLERLVAAMESADADLGFAPRRLLLDPPEPKAQAWAERYAVLHNAFSQLAPRMEGPQLVAECVAADLNDNWIGEPTAVIVRRAALERVGGFGRELRQVLDLDLWLRVMFFGAVAFVDEPLSVRRVRPGAATAANERSDAHVLDRLWMLEGLLAYREIRLALPHLRRLRLRELRDAPKRALCPYARVRLLTPRRRRERLYPPVPPAG